MKKYPIFLSLLVSCILIFNLLFQLSIISIAAENKVDNLYALSAALLDGDSGRVLYEKDGFTSRPMASTTKIMTLIIALEYGNSEDIVTVSSYACKMPDVKLNIREGEQYKLNDLYYSLMLESHNDVAVAIAEHISGSTEEFSRMMNNKAKELGLNNTYFITPNGLDAKDANGVHSSSAVELAKIMKYCVMESDKKDEFIKICQTREYTFSNYNGDRSFHISNKNALLDMMDGVIAGKTGFTADAGYCYVAAVTKDGNTYIVALLACGWPNNKSYKWMDTKKLVEFGSNNYYLEEIINFNTSMKTIDIPNGTPFDIMDTYIKDSLKILISKDDRVRLEYIVPTSLSPPVYKDEIVGHINIIINDEIYDTINVYASNTSAYKDFDYYLDKILYILF